MVLVTRHLSPVLLLAHISCNFGSLVNLFMALAELGVKFGGSGVLDIVYRQSN